MNRGVIFFNFIPTCQVQNHRPLDLLYVNLFKKVFEAILVKPFDKMMSTLKDEEWKSVRTHVTPTLTSGRLKSVHFSLLILC